MHPTIVATERMSAMVELHPPGGRPCGRPYSPSTHDACQRIARDCKGLRAAGEGPAGELHDAACTQPALFKARPWPPRCGAPEVGEQAPRAGRSPAEVRTQWGARAMKEGLAQGQGVASEAATRRTRVSIMDGRMSDDTNKAGMGWPAVGRLRQELPQGVVDIP